MNGSAYGETRSACALYEHAFRVRQSMQLYLASSFDMADRCEVIRKCVESLGHTVPDVWWNVRTKDNYKESTDAEFYGASLVQSIAARHWRTIRECDVIILVSGHEERSFTGANVEVGYAMALGKPVLSVGRLKRSAMYVPIIHCGDMNRLLEALECIGQVER